MGINPHKGEKSMSRSKWMFSLTGEDWNNRSFDTKEKAIERGRLNFNNGGKEFYIGRLSQDELQLYADASGVLENVASYMYDTAGEVAEDYLQKVDPKEEEILSTRLTTVLQEWATEFNHHPDFFLVTDIEKVELNRDCVNEEF